MDCILSLTLLFSLGSPSRHLFFSFFRRARPTFTQKRTTAFLSALTEFNGAIRLRGLHPALAPAEAALLLPVAPQQPVLGLPLHPSLPLPLPASHPSPAKM